MKISNITKETLEEYYVNKRLPIKEIALIYQVTEEAIRYNVKKYGFSLRKNINQDKLFICSDIDTLKRLASDKSYTNNDIALYFKVSKNIIAKWFNELGINRISLMNNEGKKPSKEILENEYKEYNSTELSKKYGVTSVTIKNWLKSYNILIRNFSEIQTIGHKKSIPNLEKKYGKGIRSPFQLEHIKDKIKASNLIKYGIEYPTQSLEIRDKIKQINLEKYGIENTFGLVKNQSKGELECIQKLNENGMNLVSTRKILSGAFELDGYDEDKKIAIEYCGLYWHSEAGGKDRNYHYKKWKECSDLGIKLYTIFEDEWKTNSNKIIKYITFPFNIQHKVYARNTEIKDISAEYATYFCNMYHLQGKTKNISKSYGLFLNDNCLMIMGFGTHHRISNKIAMNRLCSINNTQVIGGASKLINHASNIFQDDIITWSDNRWSNGNVYNSIGCELDSHLLPSYYWTDFQEKFSKQSRRKNNTDQPKELTETQYNKLLGLSKIWDCGKIRWIYRYKK